MPIISDISGLLNFTINLFYRFLKLLIEKPQYLIIALLIIIFFPLEFVDMFLYGLINIFVVIINILIIIFALIINVLIGVLNIVLGFIENAINYVINVISNGITWLIAKFLIPINWIIWAINQIPPYFSIPQISPPTFPIAPIIIPSISTLNYSSWVIGYKTVNIFGIGSITGITCLFDLLGIGTPIW